MAVNNLAERTRQQSQRGVAMTMKNNYFFGIDLVRFAAALIVATFHLTWQYPSSATAMPFGWIGVEVFFVISGFVIANSASEATPLKFLKGRILRLYPAAWICVAIGFIAITVCANSHRVVGINAVANIKTIIGSMTLLGPWFLASAYWTLPIEISFYSLVFLLLLSGRFDRIERLAFGLIAYGGVLIPVLWMHWRGFINAGWIEPGYGPQTMLLYRHSCYFGVGIYLWLWTRGQVSTSGILAVGVGLVLAALEIDSRAIQVSRQLAAPVYHLSPAAIFAFLIAFIAIVLSVFLPNASKPSLKISSVIRVVGLMTYPFYLLHEALGGNVLGTLLRSGVSPMIGVPASLILVGITSWIVVMFLEPAMRNGLFIVLGGLNRVSQKYARSAS